jgi:hypothetical protein
MRKNGRYPEAIRTVQQAAQSAEASGQTDMAQLLRRDLDRYRLRIPLRDPTHGGGTPSP